jgi:hypothetical protein
MWSTTPVPLMQSSSSPRYKQIVVVGVGEPERDDDVEIPSGVLGSGREKLIALIALEGFFALFSLQLWVQQLN